MDDNTSRLFVFMIIFWTLLTIFSNVFEERLSDDVTQYVLSNSNGEKPSDLTFWENIQWAFNQTIDSFPLINKFGPLFRIMSFQYSSQVPVLVTIFLDALGILTGFIVLQMIKN